MTKLTLKHFWYLISAVLLLAIVLGLGVMTTSVFTHASGSKKLSLDLSTGVTGQTQNQGQSQVQARLQTLRGQVISKTPTSVTIAPFIPGAIIDPYNPPIDKNAAPITLTLTQQTMYQVPGGQSVAPTTLNQEQVVVIQATHVKMQSQGVATRITFLSPITPLHW